MDPSDRATVARRVEYSAFSGCSDATTRSTRSPPGTAPSFYGFGDQSWQISDAVNSGSFADQPLTPQTTDQSGETNASGASNNGDTAGATHGFWESSFAFGDAGNPAALQPNLHVTVSPESGSGGTAGARMSFISIDDCGTSARPNPNAPDPPPATYECDGTTAGLQVNFQDYLDAPTSDFAIHHVATGLNRQVAHTVRTRIWFFEGPNNDVVQVCVDGTSCVVGHSWEDFYRDGGNGPSQLNTSRVDRVLFRLHYSATGDAPQPTHAGNGLFIDNLKLASQNYTGAAFSVSGPTTVAEGNAGSTLAHYNVTLSEAMPFTSTVHVATANGTATTGNSDYASTSADLTFLPGETVHGIDVPILGDTTDEPHETFSVNLSNPTSIGLDTGAESFPKYVALDNASKTTTIQDEDSTLRVNNASQNEGTPPPNYTVMPFTVTLDNPSSVTVTCQFQTSNGTATAPSDYGTQTKTVTFAPGETSKIVNVAIRGDNIPELNETFNVNLSAPTNAVIGTPTGTGTIVNDD